MAGISTHVLDNLTGTPGAGMRIDFSVLEDGRWKLLKTLVTNADGRTDEPVLAAADARIGEYELAFHIGDFYADSSRIAQTLGWRPIVPLREGLARTVAFYRAHMHEYVDTTAAAVTL